jgi:hypothetical protein
MRGLLAAVALLVGAVVVRPVAAAPGVDIELRQIVIPFGGSPFDDPYFAALRAACESGAYDGTNLYVFAMPERAQRVEDANGIAHVRPTGLYCGHFAAPMANVRDDPWMDLIEELMTDRKAQCEAAGGEGVYCGGMMFVLRTEPAPPPAPIACPASG